ncbi:MAG: TIGR02206 family membrane protein [Bryobacteraceae bacterium]
MRLFGFTHLAILAAIPAAAWLLARAPRAARVALGVFLAINELGWYGYRYSQEGNRFPEGLPLQLCDAALWVTVVALLRLSPACFEFAWYTALLGSGMAVLTPDLWAPCPSYPTVYFFLAHGGVIAGVLMLRWSGLMRPRPGSWWRALLWVNAWAAMVGTFNAFFHTNYMYLCRKPVSASMLDWFGPWPWYLLVTEAFTALAFRLLSPTTPGRRRRSGDPLPR